MSAECTVHDSTVHCTLCESVAFWIGPQTALLFSSLYSIPFILQPVTFARSFIIVHYFYNSTILIYCTVLYSTLMYYLLSCLLTLVILELYSTLLYSYSLPDEVLVLYMHIQYSSTYNIYFRKILLLPANIICWYLMRQFLHQNQTAFCTCTFGRLLIESAWFSPIVFLYISAYEM